MARAPIIDRKQDGFGYELRFRDGIENCFRGNLDEASRSTLDRSPLMGLDVLYGLWAFVPCTRDTLIKGNREHGRSRPRPNRVSRPETPDIRLCMASCAKAGGRGLARSGKD